MTFTSGLGATDDLLDSVEESSHAILKKNPLAPRRRGPLYQRIFQDEIPQLRDLDREPIKFSPDRITFSRSPADDAVSVAYAQEPQRPRARSSRNPVDRELPRLDADAGAPFWK